MPRQKTGRYTQAEMNAIKYAVDNFTSYGSRTLATRVFENSGGMYGEVQGRSWASIYGVIRRLRSTLVTI